MTDITLTFGKHRGMKLSQVPVSYVQWLSEQATICGKKDVPQAAKAFLASAKPTQKSSSLPEFASVNGKVCSSCHQPIDGQATPVRVSRSNRTWTEYMHTDCARQEAEEDGPAPQPQKPVANAPRTLKEANKLGWMAGKGYGNARSTLLAARDADGFIRVVDEDVEGNEYTLVYVRNDGTVMDGFGACQVLSKSKVLAILARYGMEDQARHYTKYL